MAKKSVMTDAKDSLLDAAKTGAEGVKSVAGEALGAAAVAAVGVVLDRVTSALGTGEQQLAAATPAAKEAARKVVTKPFGKPVIKKKAVAKKKPGKKTAAPKKKPTSTNKVVVKATKKRTAVKVAANKKSVAVVVGKNKRRTRGR